MRPAILNDLDGHGLAESPAQPGPTSVPTAPRVPRQPARVDKKAVPPQEQPKPAAQKSPSSAVQAQESAPTKTSSTRSTQAPAPQAPNTVRLEAGMSQGHVALTMLTADISALQGVGPAIAGKLHHLGIHTVRDLLFYFPREHRDYSQLVKIADIPFNELTTTKGIIWEVETKRINGGRTRTIATISDETAKLYVSWFNQS